MIVTNDLFENPRQDEYFEYLNQHILNVQRSWEEFLRDPFEQFFPENYYEACKSINLHDVSKYNEDEFVPYCNHFYPADGFENDEEAFDYAWLLHQKRNPHHWQYWVLVRDSGDLVAMDMPTHEIANMLCDWHSFSAKDPKSTAYSWYKENNHKMILSDNTIDVVKFLLDFLTEPLK